MKKKTARRELMDERFESLQKALTLQALEYERRLASLNHAHEKAIEVQHTYVTASKYDEYVKTQKEALDLALNRINEKFDEYVKRYEVRQREVDLAIGIQKAAAEQAQRFAEEQGRRSNRNLGIATLLLGLFVGIANYLPTIT